MWLTAPEPTQAQRDKGNAMAARILAIHRAEKIRKERERVARLIPVDELSEEEHRAYVDSLLD